MKDVCFVKSATPNLIDNLGFITKQDNNYNKNKKK